jgi:hypothetical protein
VPVTATVRSDTPTEDLQKGVAEALQLMKEAIRKNHARLVHVFTLRGIVHDANANSDLSILIGNIAHHEKGLAYLNSLKPGGRSEYLRPSGGSALEDVLAAIKHAEDLKVADPKLAQPPKNYVVNLMTPEVLEELEKTIRQLRLELEELKEKRNELNHQTIIELPKDMVEFLREFGLVK